MTIHSLKLTPKEAKRRLKEFEDQMREGTGKELSAEENSEFWSLREFLNGISIERKKGKNGVYKYFFADINGNKVGEIKDFYDGIEC